MKRVKFLLAFVFLLVGTLTVLALSNDRHQKSAAGVQCLRYTGPQPVDTYSLWITNPVYWEPNYVQPNIFCGDGWALCVICFDTASTSANEARQLLYDYYELHGSLPISGQTITNFYGTKQATVHLKDIEE